MLDSSFDGYNDELLYEDLALGIKEFDDYIIINGERINRPFVEKPANAEDHEIIIYYSS